ncbi:hypothetical protein PIB30_096207, partial [Stylosanthes scabra]|nr:hypothetical protein [Stylosanthes scabra]
MDPSEKGESSEEDPEMEEEYPEEAGNPEDRVPAIPSLLMDIDAEEDFQRYVEELGRAPEPSPLRSSQASVPDEPMEAADRRCAWCRKLGCYSCGIRAVRPYKAWGWTDYATLHTLSVRVSSPRALGYLCDMSSKMSGRGRVNHRGVAASPASDGEQPDLSNDFAEIAAALRESAAAMRETNAARERERESHANGDGSTAGNRAVTLTEFMRVLRAQQVPEGQRVEFAAYLLQGDAQRWWKWNQDDLGYDSEPERRILRRRREARRRASQAALEQQLNMAAEHHDDNLNLENNQNRVTLGQYINPTADSCGSTIRRPVIQANNFEL